MKKEYTFYREEEEYSQYMSEMFFKAFWLIISIVVAVTVAIFIYH